MNTHLRNGCIDTILLGLLAAAPLQAQEIHVGFVKTERIFREAASAKSAEARLAKEFSKLNDDIIHREVAFKADVDKFQIESPMMPEAQRLARQTHLADQERALQLMRRNFQDDLNARKNEELQLLMGNANKMIKQVAESERYDFIFQDAVYVNPKYDVTDKVLKRLDAQTEK